MDDAVDDDLLGHSLGRPLCVYHGQCADGFGAAWVVRRFFGGEVEFVEGRYGEPPPQVHGRALYLVDFSYKRPLMERLAREAALVVVIDHHQSAEAEVRGIANVRVHFDLQHSGAMLTWRVLFPDEEPPLLLRYIEDRDLWRFALRDSAEVAAGLFSYPYRFETWDLLIGRGAPGSGEDSGGMVRTLAMEGRAILRKQHKDIRDLIRRGMRRIAIGGHVVPTLNVPYILASDAAHDMAKGEPFAACYWETQRGREFSLRSRPDGLDVALVAEGYGGGGHRHAAGFVAAWGHELCAQ
jgi:oligoribonuclease NrnB/cAMP/cGMP phosphodiesterase (DHH superfamily)